MRRTRKILGLLLAVTMTSAVVLAGCGTGKKQVEVQENVVRIRVYDAGYGTDHLNAIISKFEETYADKGYKIVIDKANTTYQGTAPLREMSVGFEGNRIDMYYVGNLYDALIINQYMSGEDVKTADLSDVFTSAPINVDGSEGEGTLEDKMIDGLKELYLTDLSYAKTKKADYEKYEGKRYLVPFYSQPGGFVVNTEKLAQAGLEVPRTTNELLNSIDTINAKRENGDSNFTATYPVSWSGGEAYNYWRAIYDTWYAQCEGTEAYNNFYTLSGYAENLSESYKEYEREGWKQVYSLMEVLLNDKNAPADTLSMDAVSAQDRLLVGKSVFAPCGAWIKSEMGAEYLTDMEHCELIKVPVVSQVGIQLGLDGKGGSDAELCDKVLSAVIGCVDENKAAADIIAEIQKNLGVTLTEEQVEKVRDARGIYCEGFKTGWVVAEDSPSLDICKLFLRYLANDYSVQAMMELCSATSAFSKGYDFGEAGNTFDDSLIAFSKLEKRYAISRDESSMTVRGMASFSIFLNHEWETNFGRSVSNGSLKANQYYQTQVDYAKDFCAGMKE